MKTFIIGSKNLSVGILKILLNNGHDVLDVFSRDSEPGMKVWHEDLGHSSLKNEAEKYGIPTYEGKSVNSEETRELLSSLNLDMIFSCFWSEIFKKETLDIPRLGVFNFHTAYLPLNRGSRPIPWALIQGESFTGLTIHKMEPGVDNGAIVARAKVEILGEDTAKTLYQKVTQAGIGLFEETIGVFSDETFSLIPQDETKATYHPRGEPFGGQINAFWSENLKNQFRRAFDFTPFRKHRESPGFINKQFPGIYWVIDLDLPEYDLPDVNTKWRRNNIGAPIERKALKSHFNKAKNSGIAISESIAGMFPIHDVLMQLSVHFTVSKVSNSNIWCSHVELNQPFRYENGLLEIPAILYTRQTTIADCVVASEKAIKRYNQDIFIGIRIDDVELSSILSEQIQKMSGRVLTFSEVYRHFNTKYDEISN